MKYGLAERNTIEDVKTAGISVGHRDTDNLIRGNVVRRSGQAGILFRPERGRGFTGDRNTVEGNVVVDSGGEEAAAVDVQGTTAGLVIRGNELTETRAPARRADQGRNQRQRWAKNRHRDSNRDQPKQVGDGFGNT